MPTPVTGRATSQAEIANGVAQITAHDPGFSMDNLLGQVDQAFFEVQQAWVERKPELSRAVMADGCWSQHHMQISQYVSENRMNRLPTTWPSSPPSRWPSPPTARPTG